MYIWAGCKLPEDFSRSLRQTCAAYNQDIGLDTAAFQLPQHISLKISFQASEEQAPEILDFLETLLSREVPFSVTVLEPEHYESILWLNIAENARLQALHEMLDARLEERFRIPQHEFDKCFRFHSTLFQDDRSDRMQTMYSRLQFFPLPQTLPIDTFLLGISADGKPGTCKIVREIKIS